MIGVYGARAGSIGLAALFIMVLNLEERIYGWEVLFNAVYVLCGGIWYMLLSLSLYSFRPYKVTQQALGDCIQSTAGYLLLRSAFYKKDPDYDGIYSQLIDKQAGNSRKTKPDQGNAFQEPGYCKRIHEYGPGDPAYFPGYYRSL